MYIKRGRTSFVPQWQVKKMRHVRIVLEDGEFDRCRRLLDATGEGGKKRPLGWRDLLLLGADHLEKRQADVKKRARR